MAVRDEQMLFSNVLCNCWKKAMLQTYHSEVRPEIIGHPVMRRRKPAPYTLK